MQPWRKERVAELIKQEIAKILMNESCDSLLNNVTVLGVKLSGDLSHAKIYVSVIGEVSEVLKALTHACGYIRKKLAQRLQLKHTPTLSFIYDNTIEQSIKLSQLDA